MNDIDKKVQGYKDLLDKLSALIKLKAFGWLFYISNYTDSNDAQPYLQPIKSKSDLKSVTSIELNQLIDNDLASKLFTDLLSSNEEANPYDLHEKNKKGLYLRNLPTQRKVNESSINTCEYKYKYINAIYREPQYHEAMAPKIRTILDKNNLDSITFKHLLSYIITDYNHIKKPFYIICPDPDDLIAILSFFIPYKFFTQLNVRSYISALKAGRLYNVYINVHKSNPYDDTENAKAMYDLANTMGFVNLDNKSALVNTTKFIFIAKRMRNFQTYSQLSYFLNNVIYLDFTGDFIKEVKEILEKDYHNQSLPSSLCPWLKSNAEKINEKVFYGINHEDKFDCYIDNPIGYISSIYNIDYEYELFNQGDYYIDFNDDYTDEPYDAEPSFRIHEKFIDSKELKYRKRKEKKTLRNLQEFFEKYLITDTIADSQNYSPNSISAKLLNELYNYCFPQNTINTAKMFNTRFKTLIETLDIKDIKIIPKKRRPVSETNKKNDFSMFLDNLKLSTAGEDIRV